MTDEPFDFFDPSEGIELTKRNLPHWQQPGKTYFITWRTADSMPAAVLDEWRECRNQWLRRNGVPTEEPEFSRAFAKLPPLKRAEFHRAHAEKFHRSLDDCHGACVLARPELARIVGDSLLHFDGDRYDVSDFIVMPNHVHVLVGLRPSTDLKRQCFSWKHFTAGALNRMLGTEGHFWQDESFDHMVRSAGQFERFRVYIADNPKKAGLSTGQYLHYSRP